MDAHQLPKLTKKQKNVLVAAEKKRFCDQRALHIVELLIEPDIDSAWLLHKLQFIDQHHYDDVTEERSCTGLCGYPLCAIRLGRVPNHQFQISTNTNRIYDISERKKYCSNACFRASRHLKPQIQTSPLWLRDKEPPPVFRLLDQENNRRGVAGDLVDLGVARAPSDEPLPPQMTTGEVVTDMMHQFDELSEQIRGLGLKPEQEAGRTGERGERKGRRSCLRRIEEGMDGEPREMEGRTVQFGSVEGRDMNVVGESEEDSLCHEAKTEGQLTDTVYGGSSSNSGVTSPPPDDTGPAIVSPGQASHPQDTPQTAAKSLRSPTSPASQAATHEPPSPGPTCGFKRPVRTSRRQHPLKVVEARLLDWLSGRTPATAAVPVADPLRVEIPTGAGDGEGGARLMDSEKSGGSAAVEASTDPAAVITGDAVGDGTTPPAAIIGPAEAAERNRALLGYLQGRVRPPPRPAAPAPAQPLTEDGRPVPPEPLLESQDRQRRRIVHEHLSKATARLLPPLGLLMSDVASPLRRLVASFQLTAQNVTLTPSQWTLAAVILLRCLLRQNPALSSLAGDAETAFSGELQPLQLTPARLDPLVARLTDLLTDPAPTRASGSGAGSGATQGSEGSERGPRKAGVQGMGEV